MKRFLLVGFALWLLASLLLRLAPQRLLGPEKTASILVLYTASFGLMFVLMRRLVAGRGGAREGRRAAIALLLPTLLLDAFASAFFPAVYPNLLPAAAGVFGGWMLISCAGGLFAVMKDR